MTDENPSAPTHFIIAYDLADMQDGTRLFARKRWMWRGLLQYTAVMSLIFTAIIVGKDLPDLPDAFGLFASLVLSLVLAFVAALASMVLSSLIAPITARQQYRQLGHDGQKVSFEYDATGIRIKDSSNTADYDWKSLKKWTENEKCILVYRTDYMPHYIPKRQVDPVILAELRKRLAAADVPKV
jgi:hypothetical protein